MSSKNSRVSVAVKSRQSLYPRSVARNDTNSRRNSLHPARMGPTPVGNNSEDSLEALEDQLDHIEQQITLTLQEIDRNFAKAHQTATESIFPVIKRYAQESKKVGQGVEFWKSFMETSAGIQLSSYEENLGQFEQLLSSVDVKEVIKGLSEEEIEALRNEVQPTAYSDESNRPIYVNALNEYFYLDASSGQPLLYPIELVADEKAENSENSGLQKGYGTNNLNRNSEENSGGNSGGAAESLNVSQDARHVPIHETSALTANDISSLHITDSQLPGPLPEPTEPTETTNPAKPTERAEPTETPPRFAAGKRKSMFPQYYDDSLESLQPPKLSTEAGTEAEAEAEAEESTAMAVSTPMKTPTALRTVKSIFMHQMGDKTLKLAATPKKLGVLPRGALPPTPRRITDANTPKNYREKLRQTIFQRYGSSPVEMPSPPKLSVDLEAQQDAFATPVPQKFNRGAEPRELRAELRADDDSDSIKLPQGMSPPVTLNFPLSQRKLLRTPARQTARIMAQEVLQAAGDTSGMSVAEPELSPQRGAQAATGTTEESSEFVTVDPFGVTADSGGYKDVKDAKLVVQNYDNDGDAAMESPVAARQTAESSRLEFSLDSFTRKMGDEDIPWSDDD